MTFGWGRMLPTKFAIRRGTCAMVCACSALEKQWKGRNVVPVIVSPIAYGVSSIALE